MPIYEYLCQQCEQVHEMWQKITDEPATECPSCGGNLERLISRTAFSLKGQGWYQSDYKNPKPPPAASTSAESSSGDSSDSSSSDSSSSDSASSSSDGGSSSAGAADPPPVKDKSDPNA